MAQANKKATPKKRKIKLRTVIIVLTAIAWSLFYFIWLYRPGPEELTFFEKNLEDKTPVYYSWCDDNPSGGNQYWIIEYKIENYRRIEKCKIVPQPKLEPGDRIKREYQGYTRQYWTK